MVTYTGVFLPASPTVPGALEGELFGRVGMSLAGVPESNLRETMSAMLYFCTDEPTWKVISLSVPPKNLPSIRLPFFSSNESAHAIDAARQNPMTNTLFSLNFINDFLVAMIRLLKNSTPSEHCFMPDLRVGILQLRDRK